MEQRLGLLAEWLVVQTGAARNPAVSALGEEVTGLFFELRAPLLRYVSSLGLPVADGEDIVQEVFLALFHHLRQGKPRDNLRGWVFRTGHNLALKRCLFNRRNADPSEIQRQQDPDPSLNPEEQAAWNRRWARLQAVVQALPERDRCCLHLRAEGLRYREIAETLEMSLGAVALSLSRSLGKLSTADQG
jgi:RNA polymerase sigma-70 factor (ECF subfamily)